MLLHWNGTLLLFSMSGSSQKASAVGKARSSSKCCLRVAHKMSAPLEWFFPPLNLTPWVAHTRSPPLEWHPLPLNVNPRMAHERYATLGLVFPPLNFGLRWLTKGMHRCIGTLLAHTEASHPSNLHVYRRGVFRMHKRVPCPKFFG